MIRPISSPPRRPIWSQRLPQGMMLHPAESPVVTVPPADDIGTSIRTLLAGRILHDGEVVLLVIKPSFWFIALSGLKFIAAAALLLLLTKIFDDQYDFLRMHARTNTEAFVLLTAGRLVFASIQWMGRYYVLTDFRILRISSFWTIEKLECPLRKIIDVQCVRTLKERIFRIGTLFVIPSLEGCTPWSWQMVAQPGRVQSRIQAAIARARQGGCGPM